MKIILQADDFGRSHEMNTAIDYSMQNGLAWSTALLMGSEFTQEAIDMAEKGNYLQHVHCHLNLSACRSVGNHFVPLNENYKKSRFCKDGEFKTYKYYKIDYQKYSGIILEELETQFLTFKELTRSEANYSHIDFHLYANLSLPVNAAYKELIKKYNIKTARFFGEHEKYMGSWKQRLFKTCLIYNMKRNKACAVKSSKIEFFLMRPEIFKNEAVVELFVHPEYRNGIIIDRTNSVSGAGFNPLEDNIRLVREAVEAQFISWEDF